jgi:predicted RND superfamily exporter protein
VADNTANSASLVSRLTGRIVGFVARRPRLVLWPVLILACAAVGITVSELKLRTGRDALIDPATDFSKSWTQYTEDFESHGDLVVVVETELPDEAQIQSVLDQIAQRLQNDTDHFRDVLYRVDQRKLRSKALQFLKPQELQAASRRVAQFASIGQEGRWDQIRLASFSRRINSQLKSAQRSGRPEAGLLRHADRLASSLDDFMTGTQNNVRYTSTTFPSPWQEIVSIGTDQGTEDAGLAYLMTNERNMGWLHAIVVPHEKDLDPNASSITRMREICDEVQKTYSETDTKLRISVTGIPALEHDELSKAGRDMVLAALIAFAAVGGLLSFGFRSVRHPMLVLLTLVVALSCTFGVATLAVGHLNILSVCFAAILIGLGVDFAVHFLSRYLHIRQETSSVDEALEKTGTLAGGGIITSALTTALAFGSAALTGFPGLAELGIIAGSGILICAACTFLFLPALIAISDAGTKPELLPQPLAGKLFRRVVTGLPLIVIGVSLIGFVELGTKAVRWSHGQPELQVKYNSDLMNLQDPELPSVKAQESLWHTADESLLYAVAVVNSHEEARQLSSRLEALPSVHHVSEIANWLIDSPDNGTRQKILQLRTRVASLATNVPAFSAAQPQSVGAELDRLYSTLRSSHDPRAAAPAASLDRFLNRLVNLPTKGQAAVLNAYQDLLAGSLLYEFEKVGQASSLAAVTANDIPSEWKSRLYRNVDGQDQWLVKVYPKQNIWNDAHLAAFVQDVRTVAPNITGIPVQNYESSVQLKASWQAIAVYSLAIISLFLLFDFLRPGQKALTLLTPMAITGFIGYTMQQRTAEVNPNLLVTIYLSMVAFIALVVDFRNLRDTVLALLPPLAGAVLMAGTMALLQVDFNPLNLIVLPLVLGIGVDGGIHIVHDYRRQVAAGSKEYSPSGETLKGVILTSLTSIVGFGSLMIAGHQGLVSVGLVMAIGVASCLLVALIPLPALLTLVARHQPPSMEPLVKRKPKALKLKKAAPVANASANEDEDEEDDGTRPMTRREKRRVSRAA